MTEAQALAKEFSTPFRHLKAITSKKIIEQDPLTKTIKLNDIRELRFLHYLGKYLNDISESDMGFEEMLERAALEADVEQTWASAFMKSKRYAKWVTARIQEIAVVEGLTVGYLAQKIKAGIEGKTKYDDSQKFCIDQATRRIWPEVSKIEHKVEQVDNSSMDELAKARDEVTQLEQKLKETLSIPANIVMDPGT